MKTGVGVTYQYERRAEDFFLRFSSHSMWARLKRRYDLAAPSPILSFPLAQFRANPGHRRYHWGFLVGPKAEKDMPGTQYHVKNHPITGWVYEENTVTNVQSAVTLLARVLVAKIEDEERLVEILRSVPVVQGDPSWRCRTWLANALTAINEDGKAVGTARLDWGVVEKVARVYVGKKTADGRYADVERASKPKPTWDLLNNRETVP
jgi:hypothetical protein